MTEAHPQIIFPLFTNGTLLNERTSRHFREHRNLIQTVRSVGYRFRD